MRSSVLAEALTQRGHHVHFAMRDTTPLVQERLDRLGFRYLPINPDASKTSPNMMAEIPLLLSLIQQEKIAGIVVDHYGADAAYFAALRQSGALVGTIDDLGDRDLNVVDWILNQNLGADRLPYQVNSRCIRLLGPRFCLLRSQFAETRGRIPRGFTADDGNVLLTLGGGDAWPLIQSIVGSLNEINRPLRLRVVVPGAKWRPGLTRSKSISRHALEILHNVANMAEHMAWADISINAGGSTCWELCCLGVPMLINVLSRDQEMVAGSLEALGVGRRIDGAAHLLVEQLLSSPEERRAMSSKGMALVDGLGAGRVAESLEAAVGG